MNLSIESFLNKKIKKFAENLLNEIMLEERNEFLENYNTIGNGYNKRTLRTTFTIDLELKVPKVRKFSDELNYSVFEKYKRTTTNFEKLIEKMYTSRLYESDISDLLSMSSITYSRKEKILEKYFQKYKKFMFGEKKASKVIKLDATYFHSKLSKTKYTVYSAFNSYEDSSIELICFLIFPGNENSEGWNKLIDHMIKYCDLSDTKLIVSDLARHIKRTLHQKEELAHIKFQNCIWHRVMSLADCVKINKTERKEMLSYIYSDFITTQEKNYDIFNVFENFKSRQRKIEKYITIRNVEKAIEFYKEDNYSFLEVENELKEYDRKELIQTSNVEAYFSKLKHYLSKNRNYTNEKVLASKIMMFIEKEEEKKKIKKNK